MYGGCAGGGGGAARGRGVDEIITFSNADANQGNLLAVHRFHGRVGALLVAEHDEAQLRVAHAHVDQIAETVEDVAYVIFGYRTLRHDL